MKVVPHAPRVHRAASARPHNRLRRIASDALLVALRPPLPWRVVAHEADGVSRVSASVVTRHRRAPRTVTGNDDADVGQRRAAIGNDDGVNGENLTLRGASRLARVRHDNALYIVRLQACAQKSDDVLGVQGASETDHSKRFQSHQPSLENFAAADSGPLVTYRMSVQLDSSLTLAHHTPHFGAACGPPASCGSW